MTKRTWLRPYEVICFDFPEKPYPYLLKNQYKTYRLSYLQTIHRTPPLSEFEYQVQVVGPNISPMLSGVRYWGNQYPIFQPEESVSWLMVNLAKRYYDFENVSIYGALSEYQTVVRPRIRASAPERR